MITRTILAGLAAATLLASPTIASATTHKAAMTNPCKGLSGKKLKSCQVEARKAAKASKTPAKPAAKASTTPAKPVG